jgi:hypothetical protein
MKPNFQPFPHFQVLACTLAAAAAALALSTADAVAAEAVNASFNSGKEVPVSSNGFTALGKTVNLSLNFAPAAGTELLVVQNNAPGIIRGYFSNLTQGQTVALTYAGVTYHFVANYHGGRGNDLVLLWTSGESALPGGTLSKLDGQIVLALKQSRGQAPFDKPTTLEPDIPIKDGNRVLVDVRASVSKELLNEIAFLGGQVVKNPDSSTIVRAMIPLSQLETLAGRAEVKSISPARPTITSHIKVP